MSYKVIEQSSPLEVIKFFVKEEFAKNPQLYENLWMQVKEETDVETARDKIVQFRIDNPGETSPVFHWFRYYDAHRFNWVRAKAKDVKILRTEGIENHMRQDLLSVNMNLVNFLPIARTKYASEFRLSERLKIKSDKRWFIAAAYKSDHSIEVLDGNHRLLHMLHKKVSFYEGYLAEIPVNLTTILREIVAKASVLTEKHTGIRPSSNPDACMDVGYACIFCQTQNEFDSFSREATQRSKLIEETPSGPLFAVPAINTTAGRLGVVKIRKVDPSRPERGYADFRPLAPNYTAFKEKFLSKSGFKLIIRPDFEMIELMDSSFDVRAYFSDPPVTEHTSVKAALSAFNQ